MPRRFPYAKDIKKHYKKNDDIVFLYVLDPVDENPDFEGLAGKWPGNFDSVVPNYKVNGIQIHCYWSRWQNGVRPMRNDRQTGVRTDRATWTG